MSFQKLINFFNIKNSREELLKLLFLSVTFFFIIGAYTITKELKDSVFTIIVGSEKRYYSYAKVLSLLILIPILFFHAKLIDSVRKYQILCFYTAVFGVLGLICTFFLGHKTIGIYNTVSSPYRIFGWLFYMFIEGYSPLIVGVFWAFLNSITSPEDVKNNYPIIITASKISGILFAAISILIFKFSKFTDALNLQITLAIASISLLITPIIIYLLIRYVPKKYMYGYEPAYILNKENKREVKETKKSGFLNMLIGPYLLFKYPYVMGIFGMSFFFEVVNQILKVDNIIFGKTISNTISEFTSYLMFQALLVHILGLFIVFRGTRFLINNLGELKSLMLIPIATGFSIMVFTISLLFTPENAKLTFSDLAYWGAVFAFVVTRAVNYALAVPLRESLYIPTITDIRFKAKSWIDGMGSKFAKTASSSFNVYLGSLPASQVASVQSIFFATTIFFWIVLAYIVGKKFEKAIEKKEVIGA